MISTEMWHSVSAEETRGRPRGQSFGRILFSWNFKHLWEYTHFCGRSVRLLWEEREESILKGKSKEDRKVCAVRTAISPIERFPIRPMNWCGRGFLVILSRISLKGSLESQPSCRGKRVVQISHLLTIFLQEVKQLQSEYICVYPELDV